MHLSVAALSLMPLCAAVAALLSDDSPGAVSPELASVVAVPWPPVASAVYRSSQVDSACLCRSLCLVEPRCQAAGARLLAAGGFSCRLADRRMLEAPQQTPPTADQGGWFERTGPLTRHQACWWAEDPEGGGVCGLPPDCSALRQVGVTRSVKAYVQVSGERAAFCDMKTDGGGWTLLQKKGKIWGSNTSFDRSESTYARGFGFAGGEQWLGLDALAALVAREQQQLRVDIWGENMGYAFAVYDLVHLPASENRYDFIKVSGNATDGMAELNGKAFEACRTPCLFGGWWGYQAHKNTANLNGRLNEPTGEWESVWPGVDGTLEILYRSEVRLRPAEFQP